MDEGIFEIEDTRVLDNSPFKEFGSPMKIADLFGGKQQYMYAMHELTQQIYAQL
jgi:type I restriction enzyme R subunit